MITISIHIIVVTNIITLGGNPNDGCNEYDKETN